jgi:hypothetical protein
VGQSGRHRGQTQDQRVGRVDDQAVHHRRDVQGGGRHQNQPAEGLHLLVRAADHRMRK